MPVRPRRTARIKLDPPLYAFVLILLSAIVQVAALVLVDTFFKSTGVQPSKHDFAISRIVAELAAFVGSPAGMLTGCIAVFTWCRATGWIIRKLMFPSGTGRNWSSTSMAQSVTRDDINALVEPLIILTNMVFFGALGAGWFFAVAHICYTFS